MEVSCKLLVLCTVTLLNLAVVVSGYGSGAAPAACNTLQPGHGTVSADSSPYTIEVTSATYKVNSKITVTVKGESFQGFMLQARKEDGSGDPIGTWDDPGASSNARQMECTSAADTVTHSSPTAKQNLVLTWNSPSSTAGNIKFTGVVAKEKLIWWRDQASPVLSFDNGDDENGASANISKNMYLYCVYITVMLLAFIL